MLTLLRLSHPHIFPFLGVDMTLFQLSLVYDNSGGNGDIMQYIESHPHTSRTDLVSMTIVTAESRAVADPNHAQQLLHVAKGLEFLHSLDIPHGDLRLVGYFSGAPDHIPTAYFVVVMFLSLTFRPHSREVSASTSLAVLV